MGLVMIVISAAFALLFALKGLLGRLRGRSETGFIDNWLIFTVVVTAIIALEGEDAPPLVVLALPVIAAGLGVVSLILLLLDGFGHWKRSRGLLGIGGAVLMAAALLFVPFISESLNLLPSLSMPSAQAVGLMNAPSPETSNGFMGEMPGQPQPEAAATEVAALPTATPLPPRPELPTPTPTNTPFPLVRLTPQAEESAETVEASEDTQSSASETIDCAALVDNNLNLRAAPSTESELLLTVPYNTLVVVKARNAESSWWFTSHDGRDGWLLGEYLTLSGDCDRLPVHE